MSNGSLRRVGKCPLCLRDNISLCRSHFFPAAAFKIIREETVRQGYKNPNPAVMNSRALFQSSMQMTAYLLCNSCEQRVSAGGENWVLKNCWRGRTFLLKSALNAAFPEESHRDVRIYWASKIPAIDRSALAYFAASMFWRASAYDWWDGATKSPINLGPYAEDLRQYLLGLTNFPKNCSLTVVLPDTNIEAEKLVQFIPAARRFANCRLYMLHFLGIQFLLFAGKMFPAEYREMDFVHGNENPIMVTSRFEQWMSLDLVHRYSKKRLSEIAKRIRF
jgi:hypothetical protein